VQVRGHPGKYKVGTLLFLAVIWIRMDPHQYGMADLDPDPLWQQGSESHEIVKNNTFLH
jgi:hypothetical protein